MAEEQDITAPLETETLQAGWAAKGPAHPRCHAFIAMGAKTDLGQVRENNEDKFDYFDPDDPALLAAKGRIYAVADGMGGHSAGQIAAELALNVFIRSYYSDGKTDIESSLRNAVRDANSYVVDVARTVPGRSGMGATLTAVAIRDDDLFIAQVGDSRCYLLREGQLEQITEDHSWVAEQVRAGAMTLEDAEQSPFRNVITRSMGGAPEVEPDVTAVKLQRGDRYLLCSDGLSGMVPASELAELVSRGSPSASAWGLVDRANQSGGKDNITAMVLQVLDIQPWPGVADDAETGVEEQAAPVPELTGGVATENGQYDAPESTSAAPGAAVAAEEAPASARPGFMSKLFRRT